jgi:hypothetical protein
MMLRTLLLTSLAAAGLLVAQAAPAHEFTVGSITVEHPWARPAATANGAAYFGLTNHGAAPDRLVGVASPAARTAEMHATTVDAQGIATMRRVQAVDLPAGGGAVFAPGGLHLMLVDLARPLAAGASFPLTLTFERAGAVTVEVEVAAKPSHGASAGGGGHHQHGGGDGAQPGQ